MPKAAIWLATLALLTAPSCSGSKQDPAGALASATRALREGRSAEAVTLARTGVEESQTLNDPTWRWRFRQLEAESLLYGLQPKEAAALLQDLPPTGAGFDALRPRHEYLTAYAQILGGQTATGIAALPGIAERAESLGQLDVFLDAMAVQAQPLLRQGKFDEVDRMLVSALGRANDSVAYQRGAILLNLGMSRLVRNRFDEALAFFERVLLDRSIESTLVYRIALSNAGICYSRLGDLDRAMALQRRAIEGHERAGLPQYVQQSLGELGASYILAGAMRESVAPLQQALEIATANKYPEAVVWANNLSIANGEMGDWDQAAHFNEIATKLRNDTRSASVVYNTYNRARIAAGRGQHTDAIAAFEEAIAQAGKDPYVVWMSQSGLAQVYRRTGQMPDAIKHFEQALGIIEQTRAELISREYRLTFLSRLIRFHQDYVDALVEHGDVERALEVAESSRGRVLAERQRVAQGQRVPATEYVKLAKRTNTTLLSYWLAPGRSFVWVITASGIRCITLPPRQEIQTLVRGYRDFVTVSLADPMTSSSPGARLTEILLNPVLDAVPTGTSVVIVPDDALHSLSFEMLPLPSPAPHYWIEDVTVRLAPSLALAAAAPAARAQTQPSLLLIGDPTHVDTTLPPLTFAGMELTGIARAFGGRTQTLRGAEATPRAVTASHPERYSLIHFAAHATASAESPLESAILLSPDPGTAEAVSYASPAVPSASPAVRNATTDGTNATAAGSPASLQSPYKLYAREVTALPLSADVVTLSACRSAGGRAYGGEGLVGFAWAFLRAGARQVVAGLWDVDDQSTALLMERFYARLGAGATPAAALRDAKLSLLKSGGNFRKPYYWAAFAIFSASIDPS